jgi:hypothetical protein
MSKKPGEVTVKAVGFLDEQRPVDLTSGGDVDVTLKKKAVAGNLPGTGHGSGSAGRGSGSGHGSGHGHGSGSSVGDNTMNPFDNP